MESKRAILILSLLAMVLLISSEVSAREFTETSTNTKEEVVEKSNELNDAKFFGHHRHGHSHDHRHVHGHGHGGHHGGHHGDSDNGN
ncbi:cold and drought-regulated protein CORA-like isoform X1 [Vicia villosa]|uniref:cold and drought-regulated protein CORA-like isoform X1 n=1 Tax=Vicia villosa TaxID=3911 RepID=UPI00273B65C5|nr:cold and drought-regulated protein CORA-like isoform X1 [Vicia villosa]